MLVSKGSLRLQLSVALLMFLFVPLLVMLYDLLYASKSDEVILENKQEHLTQIVTEMASLLADTAVQGVEDNIVTVFNESAKGMLKNEQGVRLGLYLIDSDKIIIEGFLHEYRELSPEEQSKREQRINEEVSAGIKSALATGDTIVRVGRTWDDEFLECLRPVYINGEPVAVVWAEERMHPIFAKSYHFRRFTSYAALIGFCISVSVLLAVIFNLRRNIMKIKSGLETLEYDISFRLEPLPGEMGQITTAINKMAVGLAEREQLKEKLRRSDFLAALGRLVTGIAHELRNPLGVLRATVEVMEDDLGERCGGVRDYAMRIRKQIDRQINIVNELLDYGRPDDGVLETVDINKLIYNVLDYSAPLLRKNGIDSNMRLATGLPPVEGSWEKLQQVFLNLVVNAVQAMSSGGVLTVSSRSLGERIELEIEDTGKGIPVEDQLHIFEPFYTTKDGGCGLGLAISQQVIDIHGGQIKASSVPGKGTKMVVQLPLKRGDEKHGTGENTYY